MEKKDWDREIRDAVEKLCEAVSGADHIDDDIDSEIMEEAIKELNQLIPRLGPLTTWVMAGAINILIVKMVNVHGNSIDIDGEDIPEEVKEFLTSLVKAVQDKSEPEGLEGLEDFKEKVFEKREKYEEHPLYKKLMGDE